MSQTVYLEFGVDQFPVRLPQGADVRCSGKATPLGDPAAEIADALASPIATGGLAEMVRGRKTAAIVVSDNTRPVPYRGAAGILRPVIQILRDRGVEGITVIVATGTHRAMTETQLREMLDESAWWDGVRVINHVATDEGMLRHLGRTERTPNITVNRHYLEADLKIITGLVEPHFMAGFSGGRKAVCPGICGQDVTYGFHSASILEHPRVTSLALEGNPCHEESLRVAEMAGVDFSVNVTLDSLKQITGVFAGGLTEAHEAAVAHLLTYVIVPLEHRYDVVVMPAGYVGRNHYQCAKAGVEATRAVKCDGAIIMSADMSDQDPLGRSNYKNLLPLLAGTSPEEVCQLFHSDDWEFVLEQWQVQMWAKVFLCLGSPKDFYTCAPQLADGADGVVPETNVAGQNSRLGGENDLAYVQRMVQDTLDQLTAPGGKTVLVLPDGPYAVPVVSGE